jgi:transcriptional regulator with XRE-family HTH domain
MSRTTGDIQMAQHKKSALPIFSGPGNEAPAIRVSVAVGGARIKKGWTTSELATNACAGDSEAVSALEEKQVMPASHILLAWLDVLGIPIENVLVVRSLSLEVEQYWRCVMKDRKVSLLAAAGGIDPAVRASPEHQKWVLEFFLRKEALDEMCPRTRTDVVPDEVREKTLALLASN